MPNEQESSQEVKGQSLEVRSLVSERAFSVLESYCGVVEDGESIRKKAETIVLIAADFAGEFKNDPERQHLFDAALLYTIAPGQEEARAYCANYFSEHSELVNRTSETLSDMWGIKALLEAKRGFGESLDNQDALEDIPTDVFEKSIFKPMQAADFAEMPASFRREAFLNLAAVELYRANRYDTMTSMQTLASLAGMEGFYSPYLNTIGYDGFSSTLLGRSLKIRRAKSSDATAKLERLKNVSDYVDTMMGKPPERQRFHRALEVFFTGAAAQSECQVTWDSSIGHCSGEHDMTVGEVAGTLEVLLENGEVCELDVKGNTRIKIDEKTSDKMDKPKNAGQFPVDIGGIRFIEDDDDQVAVKLRAYIDHISKHSKISFCNAPSSQFAVQVKGDESYVDGVVGKARLHDMFEPDPNGDKYFQMSKITVAIELDDGLPPVTLEIQLVTKKAQENSRFREAAHIFYDLGYENITEEDRCNAKHFLEAINSWGREPKKSGETGLPPCASSQERGRKLRSYARAA